MKLLLIFFVFILGMTGCAQQPQQLSSGAGQAADSRSLTHISETNKLKIGMHESEVSKILGQPSRSESGFNGGYRLWFELYDPRNGSMPSNYLVSTDKNGYVTFISSGGASSDCPCPCP